MKWNDRISSDYYKTFSNMLKVELLQVFGEIFEIEEILDQMHQTIIYNSNTYITSYLHKIAGLSYIVNK